MHGGGHERGMRSGTLPTHQCVGMGEAFRIAKAEMGTENERIRMLQQRLLKGISDIEQVFINGDLERRVPHNLNMSFNFVEGESLIMGVKGIAVSSGSACTSASLEPSYVLRALGRSDELAHSSLRMTIGRFTTEARTSTTPWHCCKDRVAKLRELSPLWEMYKDGIDLSTIQWAAHCATGAPTVDSPGEHTWHTATRSSTTTRTRATSAPSTRATTAWAPAWSARRPAAT
jgi:cysteine desulfurase